jgi:hypothetical protein
MDLGGNTDMEVQATDERASRSSVHSSEKIAQDLVARGYAEEKNG